MRDGQDRTIDYLRISVTDRCNLRCRYCMPAEGVEALGHEDILRFEEIERLTRLFAALGVRHLRLTGGEPMVRRGCLDLAARLRRIPGIETLGLTSNGRLLAGRVREAQEAGVTGLNLILDALDPERYRQITRGGELKPVLRAMEEALDLGLPLKLNAVPVRGCNEEELTALAALARERPLQVRFIELMPLGCGAELEPIPTAEVRSRLEAAFGPMEADAARHGHGPAEYWKPEGFVGSLGFIGAVSHAFCERCNRLRLTADGRLKLCLNHTAGLDLREALRRGATDAQLKEAIAAAIRQKPAAHGFGERPEDPETRRMNQIGG